MALQTLLTHDRWTLDGLRVDTPGWYITALDGLRTSGVARVTGTEVPGRHGLAVRPDLDTMGETDLLLQVRVSDRDPETGAVPGSYDARRAQVEQNLQVILAVLHTSGALRTLTYRDHAGREYRAAYRVERTPTVKHSPDGLWAEVTAEVVLPTSYLTHTLLTTLSITSSLPIYHSVPGSNGPLVDVNFSMTGAGPGAWVGGGYVGGPRIELGPGAPSGAWVVNTAAGTSTVGGVDVLLHTITTGCTGGLLSIPASWDPMGLRVAYRIAASRSTSLSVRGTRL